MGVLEGRAATWISRRNCSRTLWASSGADLERDPPSSAVSVASSTRAIPPPPSSRSTR